ncbi:MAG: hypothetical protein EOP88_10335 [Verrucomicrobiaceae bacterium]|nr:MAG: hypothetical protein EOP88_10335 [Verrucomicrobiaceae bacterium]
MPIEFLNADLEITSSEDLEPIRSAFAPYGHRFSEMCCVQNGPGSYFARFEIHLDDERDDHDADMKIQAFCDAIAELQGPARQAWDHATRRVIDLGYQSDNHCAPFSDSLSLDALRRMESLRIELALTIYPQEIRNNPS